ncbi:MAG TPA: trypsin-like peptidase domain-containing protein, partial [Chthoniobacterales bacterium]
MSIGPASERILILILILLMIFPGWAPQTVIRSTIMSRSRKTSAPLAHGGLNSYNRAPVQVRTMRIVLIFALALAALPLGAAPPLAQPETGPTSTVPPAAADAGKDVVHQLNSAFTKVFEMVAPTVVIIEVTKKNDGPDTSALDDLFFNQQPQDENAPRRGPRSPEPIQSEGSGFIVRQDGFIYTNYHVIEGADQVDVKLKDGREFKAKVVGTDEKTDIAVIKIEATNLPVVQFANSDDVRVGQFAFAIGAPFKLDYTFTYGVISGKGRSKLIASGGYSISDYLQTDASINPGNSGGPLCDIDGKVVGMNTLINGLNRGLGFAIPSNLTNEIGLQLMSGHKIMRPWLGIRIESLGDDPQIRELFKGLDKGVVVRTIEADAPAYKSDLRP